MPCYGTADAFASEAVCRSGRSRQEMNIEKQKNELHFYEATKLEHLFIRTYRGKKTPDYVDYVFCFAVALLRPHMSVIRLSHVSHMSCQVTSLVPRLRNGSHLGREHQRGPSSQSSRFYEAVIHV